MRTASLLIRMPERRSFLFLGISVSSIDGENLGREENRSNFLGVTGSPAPLSLPAVDYIRKDGRGL